jgi:hypothetical protein
MNEKLLLNMNEDRWYSFLESINVKKLEDDQLLLFENRR